MTSIEFDCLIQCKTQACVLQRLLRSCSESIPVRKVGLLDILKIQWIYITLTMKHDFIIISGNLKWNQWFLQQFAVTATLQYTQVWLTQHRQRSCSTSKRYSKKSLTACGLLPSSVPAAPLLHAWVKCSPVLLSHSCVVLGVRCLFSSWWHEKETERQRQKKEERHGRVESLGCGLLLCDLSNWCSSFDKYCNVSGRKRERDTVERWRQRESSKHVCMYVWQSGE